MRNSQLEVCLALLRALAISALAQVTTGTILETVRDSTDAVVPGAQVSITETSKVTSTQYASDETGSYNAPFLAPGTYSVAIPS